jgi:hypothetical protein
MTMERKKQEADSGFKSSTNGEQAWKEATDRVSSRNADARKAGRIERDKYERGREDDRRSRAAKRDAKLIGKRKP